MAGKACLRISKQLLSASFRTQAALRNTETVNSAVRRLKYPEGTFSVNRYFHSTASTWCNRKLSTAAELNLTETKAIDKSPCKDLVTEALQSTDLGRLFAVVHVAGKQRKITTEDILIVEGDFFPTVGDKIRLEKVLLVGSKDFTLIGRPLLNRDQVFIEATVIEKTLSNFKVSFWYKPRRNVSRYKLSRIQQTMLVINRIVINPKMEL